MPWFETVHASPADHAACRALLRGGSRSFFAASVFLPRHVRAAATALYGFCREADDAVDLAAQPRTVIVSLRQRLDRLYCGEPDGAIDRAFADVVRAYGIPRAVPEALLEGFQWDTEARRYADLSALTGYAVRVAGTVGVMMARLMGATAPTALARACDLGVAMQFTNIARDVGEDARAGRVYLPLDWLREAGVDADAFLEAPKFAPGIGAVVARLLTAAERLYLRAGAGIEVLPARCRPGIRAARWLYAEIGREVERHGLDSVTSRAVVTPFRKLALMSRITRVHDRGGLHAPPLPEARFLIDAAVSSRGEQRHPLAASGFDRRVHWLVDLFHDLEVRQRVR